MPYRWNREAEATGQRLLVFTCSLSDFFHQEADPWRAEAWDVIRDCQHLHWLILTKRPELMAERLPADWGKGWPHVWLGVSVEQERYLGRIDTLKKTPAALRIVSAEPLLEPINFAPYLDSIDWVITGCERAAQGERQPMAFEWVRYIYKQCRQAGVPFFFKQYYVGNQICGDGVLDGVQRQEWPKGKV